MSEHVVWISRVAGGSSPGTHAGGTDDRCVCGKEYPVIDGRAGRGSRNSSCKPISQPALRVLCTRRTIPCFILRSPNHVYFSPERVSPHARRAVFTWGGSSRAHTAHNTIQNYNRKKYAHGKHICQNTTVRSSFQELRPCEKPWFLNYSYVRFCRTFTTNIARKYRRCVPVESVISPRFPVIDAVYQTEDRR